MGNYTSRTRRKKFLSRGKHISTSKVSTALAKSKLPAGSSSQHQQTGNNPDNHVSSNSAEIVERHILPQLSEDIRRRWRTTPIGTFFESKLPQQEHGLPPAGLVISLFYLYRDLKLEHWPLVADWEKVDLEDLEKGPLDDCFREMIPGGLPSLEGVPDVLTGDISVPYHDQVEFLKYLYRCCETVLQWPNVDVLEHFGQVVNLSEHPYLKGHVQEEGIQQLKAIVDVFSGFGSFCIRNPKKTLEYAQITLSILTSCIEAGMRFPTLPAFEFHGNCISNLSHPGENGYTGVFEGGRVYSIPDLEEDLMSVNTMPPTEVERGVITLAISYKHFWEGEDKKKKRISRRDFEAIAAFIKASHATQIRFWIDTKLPKTDDSSFERWLTRGVRPYARYLTLICPSAAASTDSFWVANEKCIALKGKGVFCFEGNGIYYNMTGMRNLILERRMLGVLLGEESLPPGVRDEDEGKVSQWALSFLGSKQNFDYSFLTKPKVDEVNAEDYDEDCAMLTIAEVVKLYGTVNLPLTPSRTWNKQNPLLKGKRSDQVSDQVHRIANWFGLAGCDDKRTIYFLHFCVLISSQKEDWLVLRVQLKEPYDFMVGNCIVEKSLMEFPRAKLLKMKVVTVPEICEWPVFLENQ